MNDLSKFATAEHPIHCSGLRSLLECPWRSVMSFLEPAEGESGEAADTGSLVHVGAAKLHSGGAVAECLAAMAEARATFPQADTTEAMALFFRYSRDTRNNAKCVLIERQIDFCIAPAPEDPTGAPIAVTGTLDQVREIDGKLFYWDIKTTKKDPAVMNQLYKFQAAAYCIGGSVLLNRRVNPGGCIYPRRYHEDGTGPAHYHFAWTFDDIEDILKPVRHLVARVRSGDVWHLPNADCRWCRCGTPDVCAPKLKRTPLAVLPHPAVSLLQLYPGMGQNLSNWEAAKGDFLKRATA